MLTPTNDDSKIAIAKSSSIRSNWCDEYHSIRHLRYSSLADGGVDESVSTKKIPRFPIGSDRRGGTDMGLLCKGSFRISYAMDSNSRQHGYVGWHAKCPSDANSYCPSASRLQPSESSNARSGFRLCSVLDCTYSEAQEAPLAPRSMWTVTMSLVLGMPSTPATPVARIARFAKS